MNEQMKKSLLPLSQFWGNLSGTMKKVLVGGVIVTVIIALAFSFLLNSRDYVVIFDELSETETSEILAKLQELNVEVKLSDSGEIMVPAGDETSVRMTLATEGYPKSGLSYYLIEQNSGMLTTDYERKQYVNMQLQERIAASVKTLDGVRDAVVTITVPEDDIFYLQEKEEPTASVILHMESSTVLTQSQIAGIKNLVAKSVSGLSKDNIALTDSQGNDLSGSTNNGADDDKLAITREIESDIKKKVSAVLSGPYKLDQFKISVTATVDADALITEQTVYSPSPDGTNSGVISEEAHSYTMSSSKTADGGIAGTSSNSEVPTYPTDSASGEDLTVTTDDSIKYQVSQMKSQSQKAGATIESISIGIAINKAAFDPGERESIIQLVSYAAGVAPESISVQNFQFYEEDAPTIPELPAGINKLYLYGGIGAGALLLLGLILLLVLRGKKKKKAVAASAGALRMTDSMDTEETLNHLFGEVEQEKIKPITPVKDVRRDEIKEFAKSNPEIVAQMIKSWLRSEE